MLQFQRGCFNNNQHRYVGFDKPFQSCSVTGKQRVGIFRQPWLSTSVLRIQLQYC